MRRVCLLVGLWSACSERPLPGETAGESTTSGAPALGHVNQLAVSDNPLLAEAEFDAFLTAVGSVPGECFNQECGCE